MSKIKRRLKEIASKNKTVTEVADELKVSRQTVYKWIELYEKKGDRAFKNIGNQSSNSKCNT